jgi:hypothetical protein
MHECLAPLISSWGFHSLWSRAVRLAARDFPFVATLTIVVTADSPPTIASTSTDTHGAAEVAEAYAAIVAEFMWLLATLIGEQLALGRIRDVWPDA